MDRDNARRRVEWGHLVLLALIIGSAIAYLLDARATSTATNNIALVQPTSVFVFILGLLVLSQAFPKTDGDDAETRASERAELIRVGLLAAAFGVFILSLETLGFDLATLLFVAGGLYLCGERRVWVIALYALLFTLIVVSGYQWLVPFPFPMTVL